MPSHVALLRGVNVGGRKVVMAELRQVVASLGHTDVATYIQSGNVIFTAAQSDSGALAQAMEAAITAAFGMGVAVVVVSRADLAEVIRVNPYPAEPNPRFVHGVFLPSVPDQATLAGVQTAVRQAAEQGSRDDATLIGRTMYLHTPDGFGRSALATALLAKRSSPVAAGTARNWVTVTKLLDLCNT